MNYLKTLVINFLVVFFANHILPGIEVMSSTKIPNIGSDLIFAFVLGLLNSLIYPVLKLIHQEITVLKIALVALILNFGAYAVIKLAHMGINVTSVEGYIFASVAVTLGGFLTNYFEMKRHQHKMDLPQ
jgi:putative membrane protein